ncbi:MAG: hypothetical protein EBT75_00150 [Proteobacteria bacterium]|nr:hypothetical protein [Pseudomonadota bacterium]NBS49064.1 hypothetical protein [Verrucomicrobiota bacterium]
MRLADQMLLAQIREALLSHIPDQQWALVEQEVEKAGGVDKVDGYTGVLLRDAIQKAKKNKVETVMSEFKAGKLKSSSGKKVKSRKQAIAIALSEQRRVKKEMLEKASFGGDRSEAGRYAATIRWQRNAKTDKPSGKSGGAINPKSQPKLGGKIQREGARLTDSQKADLPSRDLSYLANLIIADFQTQGKKVPAAARPYLNAMRSMGSINENYGADSGGMIVAYLLGNLRGYKGETAKAIKAELNSRLKNQRLSDMQPNPNRVETPVTASPMGGETQTVQSDKPSGNQEVYDTKRDAALYRQMFGAKKPLGVDSTAAKPTRDQVDRIKDEIRTDAQELGEKGSWRGATKKEWQQDLETNIKALGEIDATKKGSVQQRRDVLSQIGRARAAITAIEEIEDETSPGYFAS